MSQSLDTDEPLSGVDLAHEEAVVNGVRLHYVTAGPEDGDLVVCVHGFPEFWYSWRFQIPALVDAGYRVVAPDLRGFNRSEKPHGVDAYRIGPLTGDVAGLIDHCGRDSAHVVGHDWGGAIAWAMGLLRPQVLDRLVVMNAPHPAAFARELSLSQLRKSWYIFAFQFPWLPERALTANDCEAVARLFEDAADETFDTDDVDRYREAMGRPGAAHSAVNYYRAYFDDNAWPMAKSALPLVGRFFDPPGTGPIEVPTLLLWGEEDRTLNVGLSEGLDEWVSDIAVRRFADASHWVQCDVPVQVNEELVAFLDGH